MMLEKVLLWFILLDLLRLSFSDDDAYSTIVRFDNQSWKEGFMSCRTGNRLLPSISKPEGGLSYHLSDPNLQGHSFCFWLSATYDLVDRISGDQYPSECCEIIWSLGSQIRVECVECNNYYKYVCAIGDDQIPLCSCNGSIEFSNCPAKVTTLCIPETSTVSSDTNTDFTTLSPASSKALAFSSRTLDVNTAAATVPTRTSERGRTTPGLHANVNNSKNMAVDDESVTSTWFLYWGIFGAISSLLSASIIVIIILVIKLRRAKRHITDALKKEHSTVQEMDDINSYQTLDPRNMDPRNVYDALRPNATNIKD